MKVTRILKSRRLNEFYDDFFAAKMQRWENFVQIIFCCILKGPLTLMKRSNSNRGLTAPIIQACNPKIKINLRCFLILI